MSDSSPGHSLLVNESLRQRFEASWVAGTPEPLTDCLPGSDTAEFLSTLEELVHIQLEFAWKADAADGERPVPLQALLEEFPVLGDEDVLLRLLRQEFHCREQAGDAPSVNDYRESFPDLDLDQLTTPPGETVGPKASDDTATETTPDDQATLPLPGAASPVSVTDNVTLNAAVMATPRADDETLAASAGSPEPALLHDDATIAGEQSPAVSIVDDNSTDTINTEPSGTQVVFDPGKQVPGYELLSELGRGGMGVVYRALDTRLKRVVALKMILSGAHADEKDLKRFQREAEAVAQLQHPNIVQIHDVGEHDGQPFLSLEFVEGGGLDEKIGGEPQPPSEAAALVETLARAVHFAHERNIVHRDLKPANVLLTAEGEPKITDFGLAKRLEDDASQTASGSIMGTPSFMAPEQAGDKQGTIGPQTDVYALGALLYCLLTGRPPFQSSSVMDTVMQVLEQEPVPPRQLVAGLDRNLETITLKCLQKSPERRYQSAEEVAEELRRYQAGEPIQARPIGRMERTWRWARRNPLGALASGLAMILTVGGPFVAIQQAENARLQSSLRAKADQATKEAKASSSAAEKLSREQQAASTTLQKFLQVPESHVGDREFRFIEVLERGHDELKVRDDLADSTKADLLFLLGKNFYALGVYDRAVSAHKEALSIREKTKSIVADRRGQPTEKTLESMDSLGSALRANGETKKAIPLLEEVLELESTQTRINNLAIAYHVNGDLEKAIPMLKQILKRRREDFGDEHPATHTSMNNLAQAYGDSGDSDEYVLLLEKLVKLRQTKPGSDGEVRTLLYMGNLARAYQHKGNLKNALPLFEETLKRQKKRLGDDHPNTSITMNDLAWAYQSAGNWNKALPLLEQALKRQRTILGNDHPSTLRLVNDLALAYKDAGDLQKALKLSAEALQGRQKRLGNNHSATLTSMNNLGLVYQDAGELSKAEAVFRESLKLGRQRFADGWRTFHTAALLGAILDRGTQQSEGESLLLEGIRGMRSPQAKLPPQYSKFIKTAIQSLIKLYEAWDKPAEAAKWKAQLKKK